MRKVSIKRWLLVTMQFAILANVAHPVTPKFIKSLGLGDSMFGYAFAGMALTNFLFSPLWAKIVEKYGSIKVTVVTLIFYGLSQMMFGLSTTITTIMVARLLSGFFAGGLFVAQLLYLVNNAIDSEKGAAMVNNATMQIVFGTFGYLIGGMLGDIKIIYAFYFQGIGVFITALYVILFIDEDKSKYVSREFNLNEVNPFKSLATPEIKSNPLVKNILIVSVLASMASTLYDQSFNYYMADFFNFLPSVNGWVKAITGITAFIVNSTLTLWIIKEKNLVKSLGAIFLSVATLILLLINIDIPLIFLAVNVLYFSIHAAYMPILQDLVTNKAKDSTNVVGALNSLKSLGMIVGAVVAGLAYASSQKLPFILSILIYIIIGLVSFALVRPAKKVKTKEI